MKSGRLFAYAQCVLNAVVISQLPNAQRKHDSMPAPGSYLRSMPSILNLARLRAIKNWIIYSRFVCNVQKEIDMLRKRSTVLALVLSFVMALSALAPNATAWAEGSKPVCPGPAA